MAKAAEKGDVSTDVALVECKTTMRASISIKKDYLVKIAGEAKSVHKTPALVVSFHEMPYGVDQDWLLIPMRLWEKMRKEAGLAHDEKRERGITEV
jgi:Holliday junction resolvase